MKQEMEKIETLKQFKEYLNNMDENRAVDFKTVDGKKLTFNSFVRGGQVTNGEKTLTIEQSLLFKLEN